MSGRWIGLVVALVWVLACGPDATGAGATSAADESSADESSSEASTTPIPTGSSSSTTGEPLPDDGRIQIDATQGSLPLDFDVGVDAFGSQRIGTIAITGGTGTIEILGETLPVVTYERQPWAEFNLVLFQGLVVAPDRWYVVWIYCRDGNVQTAFLEGTDGEPLDNELAQGSCVDAAEAATAQVELPAVDMAYPELVEGFDVSGPAIEIAADGEPGWIDLDGDELIVLPWELVDCTTDCGSPGWWELHAILWDRPGRRACFAIVYLNLDSPGVQVSYSLTLPDLSDPAGSTWLEADWSMG